MNDKDSIDVLSYLLNPIVWEIFPGAIKLIEQSDEELEWQTKIQSWLTLPLC